MLRRSTGPQRRRDRQLNPLPVPLRVEPRPAVQEWDRST
jgi:hypothetical protein